MRLSVLGLLLVMTACQTREDGARQDVPATSRAPAPPDTVILETSRGRIVLELNRDKAPASVANFVRHVKAGFYDGLIFHRVAPNFVIQAGRVMEDMSERTSSAAPILNEAENGLKNVRGTVAMARSDYPHSATSEFFINLKDNAKLDFVAPTAERWGYAVFGRVVEGMAVVDAIAATKPVRRRTYPEFPSEPTVIRRAFLSSAPGPGS
jgi:cyclophilin family peptidyl-prolyl cis-trans isomerase